MLVLESAASAAARGARVYAEVLGVATGVDPACPPHRFPAASTGIVDTMTRALGTAGLGPRDVDRISTAAGAAPDESDAEVEAMRELGGPAWHDRCVALGSRLGCFDSAGALRLAAACVTVGRSGADTPRRILHHALSRGGQSLSLVVGRP